MIIIGYNGRCEIYNIHNIIIIINLSGSDINAGKQCCQSCTTTGIGCFALTTFVLNFYNAGIQAAEVINSTFTREALPLGEAVLAEKERDSQIENVRER